MRRLVVALVTIGFISVSCTGPSSMSGIPTFAEPTSASAPPAAETLTHVDGTAGEALLLLEVKGRAPRTGYTRGEFGEGWGDLDGDGCNTREQILGRDAIESTLTDDLCIDHVVIVDPYTGETVSGRENIDIDHVVSLSDAWQKGAQQMTFEQRVHLANDPLNLLAVTDNVNASKSDSDAASWLPPDRSYWCAFVARQVAVKLKYGLWITNAEQSVMRDVLATCPQEPLPAAIP